jgi:hypothetical protein
MLRGSQYIVFESADYPLLRARAFGQQALGQHVFGRKLSPGHVTVIIHK